MAALREELTEKASTLRRIDPVDFRQVTDPVFLKNALGEAKCAHMCARYPGEGLQNHFQRLEKACIK
jgi:hypothetical protein